MKTSLSAVVACLLFALVTTTCSAALLSYEGFDYTSGSSIVGQNGGFGFSQAWRLNSSGGVLTNQRYSLSYADPEGNRLVTVRGSLFLQGANRRQVDPVLVGLCRQTSGLGQSHRPAHKHPWRNQPLHE